MMRSRRENVKTPRKKNNLPIGRQLNKLNKTTLISSVSAASLPQPQSGNIKVVVRVRPLNARESGENSRLIINVVDENVLIFDPKERDEPFFFHGVQQKTRNILGRAHKELPFAFFKVFSCNVENVEIFENSTKPLINSLMDGINCSVFAYGATGAGKTYTMLGDSSNPGITYLTMEQLFSTKEQLGDERDFELGITYLEVYNEIVQDLLEPGTVLQLREDQKGGVMVAGIRYVKIASASDLYSLLEQGNKNRTQHPTDANAESSRSHAVFQLYMKMKIKLSGEIRIAKLSMIDLAGSERASATGCQGARFAEGANINKSLLALGNCINSLAASQRHIPYRDSKLTRLLKDSLGGSCQTVMIANISPSSLSYEDTYNTLRYATRAKAIKANIKRNVLSVNFKIEDYVKLVEELRKENSTLEKKVKELESSVEIDGNASLHLDVAVNPIKAFNENLYVSEILRLKTDIREEAYSRLNGLCTNTSNKDERQKRLESKRKTKEEQKRLVDAEKNSLRKNAMNSTEQHPRLKWKLEMELKNIENDHKIKLLQDKLKIYEEQFEQDGTLVEKLSSFINSQLKAAEPLSTDMIRAHESLMRHIQSIKGEDENGIVISDSGVSSATTVNVNGTSVPSNSSSLSHATVKGPVITKCSPPIERIPIGDVTFSVNLPKKTPAKATVKTTLKVQKPRFCSDQLLVEGYKPSPMKKARINTASLRLKENVQSSKSTRAPNSHRTEIGKSSKATGTLSSRSAIRK